MLACLFIDAHRNDEVLYSDTSQIGDRYLLVTAPTHCCSEFDNSLMQILVVGEWNVCGPILQVPTPVALIPGGDPMTLLLGNEDRHKVNEYRRGVDQPTAFSDYHIDTARYCRQLLRSAPRRLLTNQSALTGFRSPDAATANSLYTFMVQRFVATYQILDCASFTGQPDPVSFQTDSSGIVISAAVDTTALESGIRKLAPFKAEDDVADSHAASQRMSE